MEDEQGFRSIPTRNVYVFLRTTPHPLFTLFDAPDGVRACTKRARSNTPLQALTLLNDEAFVECAEGLAASLVKTSATDDERLDDAFLRCLARKPNARERDRLRIVLAQERTAGQDEKAVWTTLARVILNLDEFITRE